MIAQRPRHCRSDGKFSGTREHIWSERSNESSLQLSLMASPEIKIWSNSAPDQGNQIIVKPPNTPECTCAPPLDYDR